jgi:hypothetical protein
MLRVRDIAQGKEGDVLYFLLVWGCPLPTRSVFCSFIFLKDRFVVSVQWVNDFRDNRFFCEKLQTFQNRNCLRNSSGETELID